MRLSLPKAGRYIVAVSGGVDSVCLLDLLSRRRSYDLRVAHFDHGIRETSYLDSEFVSKLSYRYGLPFSSGSGRLGPEASEAEARSARYSFLHAVKTEYRAEAVITAHHLDDRIETLIINLIRGTGPRGLASIQETGEIKRPLLQITKKELKQYAAKRGLIWREDESNTSPVYLRNYVRLNLLPRLSAVDRDELVRLMDSQRELNLRLDSFIKPLLGQERAKLARSVLAELDFKESEELMASWLRGNNLFNFDHRTLDRLTTAVKTKRPGTRLDVFGGARIDINKEYLALSYLER